jgi:hypothetical protein
MTEAADHGMELHTLRGVTSGSYLVETEASWHLVDLDAGTILRTPIGAPGFDPNHLRHDGAEIRLLSITAKLGAGMIQILDLRGDGTPTLRLSTDVIRIRRLGSPPDRVVSEL